jgi:hypothetical protein
MPAALVFRRLLRSSVAIAAAVEPGFFVAVGPVTEI